MKPEIFLECYCVARKKPIKCEITKPQERKLINLSLTNSRGSRVQSRGRGSNVAAGENDLGFEVTAE